MGTVREICSGQRVITQQDLHSVRDFRYLMYELLVVHLTYYILKVPIGKIKAVYKVGNTILLLSL